MQIRLFCVFDDGRTSVFSLVDINALTEEWTRKDKI
jgi:hypothetical protein